MPRPPTRPDFSQPPRRRRAGPWKHGRVPVLGVTGAVGAGKSLLAAALGARGAALIDADRLGHAALDHRPIRDRVVARFGREVLRDGKPSQIDRRKLGALIFGDEAGRKALEKILHPPMRRAAERLIRRAARDRRRPLIALDAALLYEAGWDDLCDRVAFVGADAAARFDRVAAARGWTREEFGRRERAQWPADRKRARADFVIDNSGGQADLRAQADLLFGRLASPSPPPAALASASP